MKPQTCEKYSQIFPSMTNNDVVDSSNSSKVEKNCVQLNLSRKNPTQMKNWMKKPVFHHNF